MSEKAAQPGIKRELTASEEANVSALQNVRPAIVRIANDILASHGLDLKVARIDFADSDSPAADLKPDCAMCCCIGGYYSCCHVC